MDAILTRSYFNNTVLDYLIVLGGILVGMLILRLFRKNLADSASKVVREN